MMAVWGELTKKREGAERYIANGLGIAIAGVVVGLWGLVVGGGTFLWIFAATSVVAGLVFAGFGLVSVQRRRRDEVNG